MLVHRIINYRKKNSFDYMSISFMFFYQVFFFFSFFSHLINAVLILFVSKWCSLFTNFKLQHALQYFLHKNIGNIQRNISAFVFLQFWQHYHYRFNGNVYTYPAYAADCISPFSDQKNSMYSKYVVTGFWSNNLTSWVLFSSNPITKYNFIENLEPSGNLGIYHD